MIIEFIKKLLAPPFELPQSYKKLVYDVATGEKQYTHAALKKHRELLKIPEYKETLEYGFMHELDNPVPDLLLKIHFRKLLIKSKSMLYKN